MDTTLATPEWQAFTQRHWDVEPVTFDYAPRGPGGPTLRAICYSDRKGRLLVPPFQPHLPLEFKPTPTDAAYRVQRQWLETARWFVDDVIVRGICGELKFGPVVADPRPWMWSWFRVSPRFTNYIDFPFAIRQADRTVRQQVNKAVRAGYTCRRSENLNDALRCLSESEHRKGFAYGVTLSTLQMADAILGPESFRAYVCYASNGEPAAARVVLHRPCGRACDWLAGTVAAHLHSGATQQLISFMLEDLQQAGASGYNSCGANLESIAVAKTVWGGRLVTQFSIQAYDYAAMKRCLGNMVRFTKRRAAVRKAKAAPVQVTNSAEEANPKEPVTQSVPGDSLGPRPT